jgi:hypothetical protein
MQPWLVRKTLIRNEGLAGNMRGELVKLRAIEPSDAEALWRWVDDPEVVRWPGSGSGSRTSPATGSAT